jgi:hypothetical protein
MPKFMKVATTDELEDQQAKLVEVEGQKITKCFAHPLE